jgi:1,6-anhydro-N-acetylmuramate kinase
MADRPLRSPSGGIQVITTERGLPIRLKLDQREFNRTPQDLARDILALCKLSATRAQVAHRRELAAKGHAAHVLRGLNLATEEDLVNAEAAVRGEQDDDGPPDSWMRSV